MVTKADLIQHFSQILSKYIPKNAVEDCAYFFADKKIVLQVKKSRASKLGDFRSPRPGELPKITINHNLNPYSFLVTLLHEMAHFTVWEKHKNRVQPHGVEWKNDYSKIIFEFLQKDIFPQDVEKALYRHLNNPSASSCSDAVLNKTLALYDKPDDKFSIEEIRENEFFLLDGKRIFKKGELQRKRYKCQDIHNKRHYLVSDTVRVYKVDPTTGTVIRKGE